MKFNSLKNRITNYSVDGTQVFLIAFLILYLGSFIKLTTYADYVSPNLISRFSYLVVGILLIKIYFFDKLTISRFIFNSAILLLAIIVWRKTHAFDIMICTSLILGAKNVDFQFLVEWFFKIGLIIILFVVVSSQVGIIKDLVYIRDGFSRHSLGVNYPTDFGAHILYLVFAYCYLYFRKLSWRSYLGLFFLGLALMAVTQARLDVIAIFITIPVMWIAKKAFEGRRNFANVAAFYWIFPAILAYVSVFASAFYTPKNKVFHLFNKIFSERLRLSHMAIERYGIHPLGNLLVEHGFGGSGGFHSFYTTAMGKQYFYIDSSFVRLFVIYGIVIGIGAVAVMSIIALQSVIKHDYCIAGIMLVVSISCVIEPHLLDVAFNPFLMALLAANVYYRQKNGNILEDSK